MNIEDLKQSWLDLREETRKQKIVTDELIRSVINDRVERLGQGFKIAGILFAAGFAMLLAAAIPYIDLFVRDFGGGLERCRPAVLVGYATIVAQYLLAVAGITRLYRAYRDISAADNLLRMSRALQRYNRLKRNLKPPMIALQIILLYIAMNILVDERAALTTVLMTVPAVMVIYTIKNRRDARDIREIERRIDDLRRSEERNNI